MNKLSSWIEWVKWRGIGKQEEETELTLETTKSGKIFCEEEAMI